MEGIFVCCFMIKLNFKISPMHSNTHTFNISFHFNVVVQLTSHDNFSSWKISRNSWCFRFDSHVCAIGFQYLKKLKCNFFSFVKLTFLSFQTWGIFPWIWTFNLLYPRYMKFDFNNLLFPATEWSMVCTMNNAQQTLTASVEDFSDADIVHLLYPGIPQLVWNCGFVIFIVVKLLIILILVVCQCFFSGWSSK